MSVPRHRAHFTPHPRREMFAVSAALSTSARVAPSDGASTHPSRPEARAPASRARRAKSRISDRLPFFAAFPSSTSGIVRTPGARLTSSPRLFPVESPSPSPPPRQARARASRLPAPRRPSPRASRAAASPRARSATRARAVRPGATKTSPASAATSARATLPLRSSSPTSTLSPSVRRIPST